LHCGFLFLYGRFAQKRNKVVLKGIKKISKILSVVLLVLAAFIVNENLTAFSDEKEYYIATADLNVRTGKGTQYAVIFTLQEGNEVEVLSKNNNWYQIRHLGRKGYAHSEYLKYSKTEQNRNARSFNKTISLIGKGIIACIILVVSLLILIKVRNFKLLRSVTKTNRGTRSERDLVLKLLKFGIPAKMIFHDVYLSKNNGEFSQIDLVVITDVGIMVFEVKDYSGWIYGSGYQTQWTKVLAYGKEKIRFYNPIMQNNKHIGELKKNLNLVNVPFYSLVIFYGNCILKDIDFVPRGTFLVKSKRVKEVMKIILKQNETFEYNNIDEMLEILKEAVKNGASKENQKKHIENIKDMIGKDRIFE
jgi:uncharacterized protein YraI